MKNPETTSKKLEKVLKIESETFSRSTSTLSNISDSPFLKEMLAKKTEYTFPLMDTVSRLAFESPNTKE